MKRKCFETEEGARAFSEKVNGKVRQAVLPNYMWVDIVWVVEWEE